MSPWALNRSIRAIAAGAVFGYPTDTIWGLGCHPLYASSVERILAIKGRTKRKGLILLSSSLEYCKPYLNASDTALASIRAPITPPTTWLVEASAFCPPWIHGKFSTVAVRIADTAFLQSVCERLESPLVSTSANRAGCAAARNLLQMRLRFGGELDFIVSGYSTGSSTPSQIKSLAEGTVIRKND